MKVFIPQMSDHTLALAGVMRGMDIDAAVLPKSGEEAMAIGRSLCRGRECLPCFLCTGDLILKCRELGDELGRVVFFMPTSRGACRFGQYNVLQKQILAEEGFSDAQFVSPSSTDAYALFGDRPRTLRARAWQSIVAVDLLIKVLHEHRPYEVEPGSADAAYQASLTDIVAAAEAGCGERLVEAMRQVGERFSALAVDRSASRPLIGIVGEIYLLQNTRANLELVRTVEAAGGEVLLGTCMDYLYLVDWKRKAQAVRFGNVKEYVKAALTDLYQGRWERRLLEPLESVLRHPPESPVDEAMDLLRRHYEPLLGTEAVLTMGRALDLYRHGVAGFINVLPFSCMPGAISAAMAPALREEMRGIPWLDISYDGQKDTNVRTRLEAFMHQAAQFDRRVVRSGDRLPENGTAGPAEDRSPGEAQTTREAAPHMAFTRRRIASGVALSLALAATGLVILFTVTGGGAALGAVRNMSLGFMGLALTALAADLLVGSLRYHIFLRRVKPGTPYTLALRAQLANRFMGAITPSQTGGGPALLYIFHRGGVPVAKGLSVLVVNFLATLVFFTLSAVAAAFILRGHFSQGAIGSLLQYGVVAFGLISALLFVALLRPDFISRVLTVVAARLTRSRPRRHERLAGLFASLAASVDQYRATCLFFLRKTPELLLQSLVLVVLLYAAKFTMAYFVVRGLGADAGYVATLAVQTLLHFVLYLAPSPGASGLAELGTGAFMAILLPVHLLGVFTIAYRFFLVYLPAVVGAFVLASMLKGFKLDSADCEAVPVRGCAVHEAAEPVSHDGGSLPSDASAPWPAAAPAVHP